MSSSTISPLSYTNPVTSSSGSSSSNSSSSNTISGVSPDEGTFLTLLVAQLKYQDPTSPADSTQFVGELAQFSSLEQLMTINQNVGSITNVVAPASSTSSSSSSSGSSGSSTNSANNTNSIDNQLNSALTDFGG